MAGSMDASPVLQQTDRQVLIRDALTATTKQLDRNTRYADPEEARDNRFQRDGGGGIGITVERTDDKKILIRAVQDGSPSAKAGVLARRPDPGDQRRTDDRPHPGRCRVSPARLDRRAGHAHRAAALDRALSCRSP